MGVWASGFRALIEPGFDARRVSGFRVSAISGHYHFCPWFSVTLDVLIVLRVFRTTNVSSRKVGGVGEGLPGGLPA